MKHPGYLEKVHSAFAHVCKPCLRYFGATNSSHNTCQILPGDCYKPVLTASLVSLAWCASTDLAAFVICDVGSAFGPDYAHHEGTAFGFYASGFGHLEAGDELQSDPGRPVMIF